MKQEDKNLLLEDLSARLPYGVKLQCGGVLIGKTHQRYMKERCDAILYSITEVYDNCYVINARYDLIEIKPYLRPISSMTEEEDAIFNNISNKDRGYEEDEDGWIRCDSIHTKWGVCPDGCAKLLDYLNSIHIDYRGLIEKGLAIEAPEGMYNI